MSGKKSIVLLNGGDKRINPHFCYKKLRSAVRRAIDLNITEDKMVTIYDSERGRVLAVISKHGSSVNVSRVAPRLFAQLWEVK